MNGAAQSFLCVVLLATGLAKLADQQIFRQRLATIPWVPDLLVRPAAVAVPLVELLVAGLLLGQPRIGASFAVGTLVLFTGVIIAELARGRSFTCGCFGGVVGTPVTAAALTRNGVLLAVAVVPLIDVSPPTPASLLTGAGLGMLAVLGEVSRDTIGSFET